MIPPSSFPIYDPAEQKIRDGAIVSAPDSCHERLSRGDSLCISHYASIKNANAGFHQCPSGFTSLSAPVGQSPAIVTAVVASPRFGSKKEAALAKKHPVNRVSRDGMKRVVVYHEEVAARLESALDSARKNLPQALHELRKLNKIVKDAVDNRLGLDPLDNDLRAIEGAAQIMSNIFEVVEALANIEALTLLKMDEHIALFDLAFKAKKIYQVRAKLKPIHIQVEGDEWAAISGSKKSFPIVLTVLIENAIKYGIRDSGIYIRVRGGAQFSTLSVSNKSANVIDPVACFTKGVRFGADDSDGSGLGLYLAKKVVEAHKGVISCTQEGGVVTMIVEIPNFVSQGARFARG